MKGSRYITHMLRLRNIEKPLANFYASGILNLRDKLGPFLWQFPEMFHFKPERLEAFFELLPRNTEAGAGARPAARCAHDRTLAPRHRRKRPAAPRDRDPAPELHERGIHSLLKKHDIGLVVADTAGKWPKMLDVTSDFVYVRLHGDVKIYTSGYSSARSQLGAPHPHLGEAGRDVYVYFDNDVKVRAPFDALNLMRQLGLDWQPPGTMGDGRSGGIPRACACRA